MARGSGKREGSGKIYIGCSKGMFVRRMDKPNKDTIERVLEKGPKKGEIVYEYHFNWFEGQLLSIRRQAHEQYGISYEFEFDVSPNPEEKKIFVLKLNHDSGYAKNILMKLPNCDLKEDLCLTSYKFTPTGQSKPRMGISVSQNDNKVPAAFTKDEPNGMPQIKQVVINGKSVWDSTEQMEFFEKMLEDNIRPLLAKNVKEVVMTPQEHMDNFEEQSDSVTQLESGQEGEEDDLPF